MRTRIAYLHPVYHFCASAASSSGIKYKQNQTHEGKTSKNITRLDKRLVITGKIQDRFDFRNCFQRPL